MPDVDLLGPVPNTAAQLEIYLHRLDQVSRAMTVAQNAYTAALTDHSELSDRLDAYRAKATATKRDGTPEVARAYQMAREELDRTPCRMVLAGQLVSLYQTYLQMESP